MNNFKGFNRLSRKPSHRRALHRNMVTSLIRYEKIRTTAAKAKEIRRTAEKLVTRAKMDSVHNRRIAAKTLYGKDVLHKLFVEVGPRFIDRPGGYTRIMETGYRSGDAAQMVILEFLQNEEKGERGGGKNRDKRKNSQATGRLKRITDRKSAVKMDARKKGGEDGNDSDYPKPVEDVQTKEGE